MDERDFEKRAEEAKYATQEQVGCNQTPIRSISHLANLKMQREHLFRELTKVNEKIEILEKQPQWVLDIVDKMNRW
jgi:hypothetical protein